MDNPGSAASKFIMNTLTYKIHKNTGSKKFVSVETIKNYKTYTGGMISVPQGRLDLIPDGYNIVDKRVNNPVPFPTARYELRPDQQEIYDQVTDTCFINALVGWVKHLLHYTLLANGVKKH